MLAWLPTMLLIFRLLFTSFHKPIVETPKGLGASLISEDEGVIITASVRNGSMISACDAQRLLSCPRIPTLWSNYPKKDYLEEYVRKITAGVLVV